MADNPDKKTKNIRVNLRRPYATIDSQPYGEFRLARPRCNRCEDDCVGMHASIVPVILAMAIRLFNCNFVGGQRQMHCRLARRALLYGATEFDCAPEV